MLGEMPEGLAVPVPEETPEELLAVSRVVVAEAANGVSNCVSLSKVLHFG